MLISYCNIHRLSGRDAEQANRGLPPKQAIWLYVSTLDEKLSRDLFCSMKKIHSSASINVEALRKLVKVGTQSITYTFYFDMHIIYCSHNDPNCNIHRNLIREQSIEAMICSHLHYYQIYTALLSWGILL